MKDFIAEVFEQTLYATINAECIQYHEKTSEYHQEIPQRQNSDQSKDHEEETQTIDNLTHNKSKATRSLSFHQRDDCLTRMGTKNHRTKQRANTKPPLPTGAILNN